MLSMLGERIDQVVRSSTSSTSPHHKVYGLLPAISLGIRIGRSSSDKMKEGRPQISETSMRAHERALEIFRETPSSELKDLVYHDHIEKHSKHSFETLVKDSGHIWDNLPDSVIGTMIYFILVEHNEQVFNPGSTLYYTAMVGFPVYFTFLLQADIVYELYLYLGTTNVSNFLFHVMS